MEKLTLVLQIIAALGLLNVWLLRHSKATPYRGGTAKNMREEFAAYGLPGWAMYVVGGLKICIALVFLVGLWVPGIAAPAAILLAMLMFGAFAMHLRVKDPIKRALPSIVMLVIAILIVLLPPASL